MKKKTWPDVLPRQGNAGFTKLDSIDPWFEIYRVNDTTFGLLEPWHREEPMSYLITGNKKAVLFDTGMGIADMRAEVERLTPLPVTVINSHSDYDHLGDNHRFDDIRAFDCDYEIERIQRGYTIERCRRYMDPAHYIRLPDGFDPTTYQIQPSRVTKRLRHLETMDLGARVITVHHTPGHTPGSVCLTDDTHGLLFTGDTFYAGLMEVSDLAAYIRSLDYLTAHMDGVDHLCPAHNEVYAPKTFLSTMLKDLRAIAQGRAPFETNGDYRTYYFDDYPIKMPHSVAEAGRP